MQKHFFSPLTSVLYFHNAQFHHKVQTFGFSTGPKHVHTHTHCMESERTEHATWQNVIMLMQFWIQRVYSLQEKESWYLIDKKGLHINTQCPRTSETADQTYRQMELSKIPRENTFKQPVWKSRLQPRGQVSTVEPAWLHVSYTHFSSSF